jgi:hypothetical protein
LRDQPQETQADSGQQADDNAALHESPYYAITMPPVSQESGFPRISKKGQAP